MPKYSELDLPVFDSSAALAVEKRSEFSRLRQECPVARSPLGPIVVRHQEVSNLLRDHRLRGPGTDVAKAAGIPEDSRVWKRQSEVLLFTDGEDHLRLRRLISKAFTPRAIERLRSFTRNTFRQLVDAVYEDGRADAIEALCKPFPGPVICELIGIESWEDVRPYVETLLLSTRFDAGDRFAEIEQAQADLDEYMNRIIVERRRSLRDDLLSTLIAAEEQGDRLSNSELLATVTGLFIAGTDTTCNQLGNAIHTFARQARSWTLLQRNPDLIPAAVEEAIRWEPVSESLGRIALEDIEIGGCLIPADTLIVLSSISANQDSESLPDGDRFDLRRTHPPGWQLLTFGAGPHYCIGAGLARMELIEAMTELLERFKTFKLDGEPDPIPPGGLVSGYQALPISWA